MFWNVKNIKREILLSEIVYKMRRDFKCEIKSARRWQQVPFKEWVIEIQTADSFRKCSSEKQIVGEIERNKRFGV